VKLATGLFAAGLLLGACGRAVAADSGKPVGMGAGVIVSSHSDVRPWVTANIRLGKGSFVWEPEVSYWSREPDRNDTLSHVLGLGVNAIITSSGKPIRVWGGAGLGIQLLRYAPIIADEAFTEAYPTLGFLAGVDYRVSRRATLFGAVRADFFLADDPNGAKAYAGLRLHL
jgi:hypothetical protein